MEKILKQVILLLCCSVALADLSTGEIQELKKRIERSSLDICGHPSGLIDLSPIAKSGHSPWNIAEKKNNETHYYDLSPCTQFGPESFPNYNIPKICYGHNLCYRVVDKDGKLISASGFSLGYLSSQLDTVIASYIGPSCPSKPTNKTIQIRFSCGVHLGHPRPPSFSKLSDNCMQYLEWETLVACKNKSSATSSFNTDETRCYVLDDKGSSRDLTPLIQRNSSYRVWSDNSLDSSLYINVCGEVKGCSLPQSAACMARESQTMETVGTYAWYDLKFHSANQLMKHDYIELTYRAKTPRCMHNASVTRIRFICPSDLGITTNTRRYPNLVSSLDCDYEIEWYTDYACASETITSPADQCQFEELDFNNLKRKHFEIDVAGYNSTKIVLNVCSNSADKSCDLMSQACLIENNKAISIGSIRNSKFVKADERLNLILVSKKSPCIDGGNVLNRQTLVEFECDDSMQDEGMPQLHHYDNCSYVFKWRTPFVCPLFKPKLSCLVTNAPVAVDLSRLTNNLTGYTVQNSKYKILFNICDKLPSKVKPKSCSNGSAACLVNLENNSSISLGNFKNSPTFNSTFHSVQLLYTVGDDLTSTKKTQMQINFFCSPEDHEPDLVVADETTGRYVVDWKTRAACYKQLKGTDCVLLDYSNSRVYDLNKLRAPTFYTVKSNGQYEFELNICGPIVNGSCGNNTSICQKEMNGQRRSFSLGQANSDFIYWNSLVNMTFTNGTPYRDQNKTPRKSHIEFICDYTAKEGYPEFDGERDQSYFFRWYTSLVCPNPPPKVTHCVYENATHFIDLTPLSLDQGNHFLVNQHEKMFFINFCKPINHPNLINCSANTGVCMIIHEGNHINLGEPSSHPFRGFDGSLNLIFDNGDVCPGDRSKLLTSRFHFECDRSIDSEVDITLISPNHLIDSGIGKECDYEFLVRSPLACAKKFEDFSLDKCLYIDPITNLSADLSLLRSTSMDLSVSIKKGSSSFFHLNICQPIKSAAKNCSGAAICLHGADNTLLSYGKADGAKVYKHGSNLHLRFTGGTVCDPSIDNRGRSTDIKLICNPKAVTTGPTLLHYDYCFAQFEWETQAVCNLVVPSCSTYDNKGNYYSLRQLSSLVHTWNVSVPNSKEEYLINVCKPLPINACGSSAGACRMEHNEDGSVKQHLIGRVSDHELTVNETTGYLYLTYEDGEHTPDCNLEPVRTQIMFRCDLNDYGLDGPRFLSLNHCSYHFVWDTRFACPHQSTEYLNLKMNEKYRVVEKTSGTHWDLASIFNSSFEVLDTQRPKDNYTYVFDFKRSNSNYQCTHAAICQTKGNNFYRDIGTQGHWQLALLGDELSLVIDSNSGPNQWCGRNSKRHVASQIFFKCAHGAGLGHPQFLYESDDCDYFFIWESAVACPILPSMPTHNDSLNPHHSKTATSSSSSVGTVFLVLFLLSVTVFIGWIVFSKSTKRDEISQYLRRMVRGKPVGSDIPFRYQQLKS